MTQRSLASLMVENHYVVGLCLNVIGDDIGAPLTEGLHNFRRLRSRAAVDRTAVGAVGAAASTRDLPGLAIRDEDTCAFCWSCRGGGRSQGIGSLSGNITGECSQKKEDLPSLSHSILP